MPHQKPVQGSHQGEDTPAVASITSKNVSKSESPESTNFQYGYREFEGFKGKRLLKRLMKYILPGALCSLWEAIIEFQKQSQEAYIGVDALAEYMNRCERTIRNGLRALQDLGLLVLQKERILLRQSDGSFQARKVTCKKFDPLHDLAFRYMHWEKSPEYVPPTWDHAEFILNHEEILFQVRDFANYRRLFKKKPGPKKRHQGEEQEHLPAIRCSNTQCSYCYNQADALKSELHMRFMALHNVEDMLECDKSRISTLWNKYLQGYSPYTTSTFIRLALILP
ncbi:hypothetical protein KSC_012110 [Ktedonobacter sp. SOSP1-52]|uniref:hypothetical protein n=1 Tax=Ktedonobacter sp. SOSP1-52 TaxID=2778366 RepID=UPI001915C19C|nr:hypothetical protein [Ktedonobacter sp. SOSP1-52]GHO62319.1 hypothetical protein KSC_012110 [Ktedonobacter sp. SOSP1-52]